MKNIYIAALCAWLALSCSSNKGKESESPSLEAEIQHQETELLGINEDEVFLRKEPKLKGSKIVNQKATEALHETHYITVDKSVKVKILEKENGWSKVQVIVENSVKLTTPIRFKLTTCSGRN